MGIVLLQSHTGHPFGSTYVVLAQIQQSITLSQKPKLGKSAEGCKQRANCASFWRSRSCHVNLLQSLR